MDPRHAVLFEPVQVGPKTLPNRFYQVPHASGFGSERPRTQAAFRAVKAEGGWGGVCVEYAPVSRDADEMPAVGANLWDDEAPQKVVAQGDSGAFSDIFAETKPKGPPMAELIKPPKEEDIFGGDANFLTNSKSTTDFFSF